MTRKKRRSARHSWWISAVSALLSLVASSAAAQEAPLQGNVELSESQLDLNQRAIEFIGQGNLEKAAQLFESSLALGESNITYLNLGRTKARLGLCTEAAEIYGKVESAPRVPEPTPVEIAQTLERYRGDLAQCGAQLTFQCDPSDVRVQVDDAEPVVCPSDAIRVDAGTHQVVAIGPDDDRKVQQVTVTSGEKVQLMLVMSEKDAPAALVPPAKVAPAPQAKLSSTAKTVGWSLLASGGAVLFASAILDWFVITPAVNKYQENPDSSREKKRLEGLQTVNRVLIPTGLVLGAGGGAVLLFWPRQTESGTEVSVGLRTAF